MREEGNFNWNTIALLFEARLREAISSLSERSLPRKAFPACPTIKGLSKLGWDSHNKKLAQGGR